jgi:hypothetical protein
MLIFKLVIGALIVAGTFYALVRLHREFRGESPIAPRSKLKNERSGANELESFIAAYRRDKEAAANGEAPADATVPPAVAAQTLTSWVARKSYLTPHIKLCYLVVKTALPDHHVFCNARLLDALELHAGHPLANARIDIVVCNKELAPVAAIDISNAGERDTSAEREKVERLHSAGVRCLRFTPGGIPKPAELRDLIYRM